MLPGSRRWVDGYGDCKAAVLVRYRIHCYTEALKAQEYEERNKPKGKVGKR